MLAGVDWGGKWETGGECPQWDVHKVVDVGSGC